MKQVNLKQYNNKAGWRIVYDKAKRLWKIINEKGDKSLGATMFTSLKLAEHHLANYLEEAERYIPASELTKEEKKEIKNSFK